ncbi:hypothetical protein [Desertivirga xinjiangensis]|uniref:hypothetical protein n=1 Tax=Desertivirga xinjiangensis TaxID=539206 RepID=UPI002109FCE5|nr:hypothetical protein [Pedobacter xinjiangensis]
MDSLTRKHLENLGSPDAKSRNESFNYIIGVTERPVDWAYEVWEDLLSLLKHRDNHQRAVAAKILANLAKSDPEKRMLKDLNDMIIVTRDERFVTARHSLQSLWKVAAAGKELQSKVIEYLIDRFMNSTTEKHYTLIRYDIIQVLKNLYEHTLEENVKLQALQLIGMEKDIKYKKKYLTLWKSKKTGNG